MNTSARHAAGTAADGSGAAVEIRGLVKTFGSFRAVDRLDLTVERGEVHGFLGPNGAGKSTTIRTLLGLYRADAGTLRVLGHDPATDPAALTRRVSYVPGDVALWPNLTGQQVLDALAGLRGNYDQRAERELVDAFSLDPRRRVRTYSKGNRQKVMLVAAFAARTDLVVLDEPTSGLDPLMEEVFQACVRNAAAAGRTVLLSSHILGEVDRLCASVTIIKDGRLVEAGELADLRHLASARITAQVPAQSIPALRTALTQVNAVASAGLGEDGALDLPVPQDDVPQVLGRLLDAGATELTCTPATLDDLFLRHYEVAAR
jgi:ABC-2 type transport system ATP-binding protein